MTHRSRISTVLVDTGTTSYETVARFWSAALGRSLDFKPQERYANLPGAHLDFVVQRVEPGREGVHFDIETDDVEAEVKRLERLGAKRVHQVKTWWVMEDPGGHRFCVVRGPSTHWPEGAAEWP